MVLLEMNHVKKSFDGNGVLEDISLTVNEGRGGLHHRSLRFRQSPHCFAVQRFWKKWTAVS